MSRRIATLFAFACSALIVAPAVADPECFDNCRMPDVVDAPATESEPLKASEPPPELEVKESVVDAVPPPIVPPRNKVAARPALAPAPAPIRPQMVVDPATKRQDKPEPRYSADAAPRQAVKPEPVKPLPRPQRTPEPASAVADEPVQVQRDTRQRPPRYAVAEPATGSVGNPGVYGGAVVAGPTAYAEGGAVTIYSGARPDPSWKRCQIDQYGRDLSLCGPTSYHPYGAGGYRPTGTYRPYAATPGYVLIPDARIIHIEAGD